MNGSGKCKGCGLYFILFGLDSEKMYKDDMCKYCYDKTHKVRRCRVCGLELGIGESVICSNKCARMLPKTCPCGKNRQEGWLYCSLNCSYKFNS